MILPLVKTKLALSKSEAKRLIFQKGVKIEGLLKEGWKEIVKIKKKEWQSRLGKENLLK